uniref:hypothetical protein n=1 Tax=Mycobacterium sp. HUMS_1102779 TaxID=3383487 RepID=UPI00389A6421
SRPVELPLRGKSPERECFSRRGIPLRGKGFDLRKNRRLTSGYVVFTKSVVPQYVELAKFDPKGRQGEQS